MCVLKRYLTQMAAARLGAVLVNINPAYQPQELLYCLNKVGVKAIVAAERFKTQDYFSILEQVVPELESAVLEKVESDAVPSLSRVVMLGETRRRGALSLEQVLEAGGRREIEEVQELQPMVDRWVLAHFENIQESVGPTLLAYNNTALGEQI